MAKTINSICFTILLLVVLLISAEIPKSEAWCGDKYLGEATVPYPCKDSYCEAKCAEDYKESCRGDCEEDHDDGVHLTNDHDDYEEHCYCYGRH